MGVEDQRKTGKAWEHSSRKCMQVGRWGGGANMYLLNLKAGFFFFFCFSSITTPQVEKNCDRNAGGNYISNANYRVQVEGHFVTDGVCVWL